jgi:hypothetical protein
VLKTYFLPSENPGLQLQLKIAQRRLATTVSKTRRVSRFLDNDAVRVREWYEPVARGLLAEVLAHGSEVRLLADGTKVGFGSGGGVGDRPADHRLGGVFFLPHSRMN